MYLPVFQPGIPYVYIQKQPFSVFVFVIVLVWYGMVWFSARSSLLLLLLSVFFFIALSWFSFRFSAGSTIHIQIHAQPKKIRGPIVLILGRMLFRIIPESAVG